MKLLTLTLLAITPGFLLADGFQSPINDREIKANFEKRLGTLRDQGKLASPAELATQLKKQKQLSVKLPAVPANNSKTSSIYQDNKKGILCFGNIYKCDRCDNWHSNIAGGFIISKDGLAVTNYHVMENKKAGGFGATTMSGEIYPVEKVVASSKKNDLAIVQLSGKDFHPLPIAEGGTVGSDVTVISHPEGRFYTVSKGIISRYYSLRGGDERGSHRMSITADFAKGSSGSPVFNQAGTVVGVVASTNSIYYNKSEGVERNLQMVIKSCIPSGAILELLTPAKKTN